MHFTKHMDHRGELLLMGVADELHLQRIAGLTSGGLAVRSRRVSPFLIPNPVPALPVGEHVYNICLHIYYDNQ